MMPMLPIYSSAFYQMGMGIDGVVFRVLFFVVMNFVDIKFQNNKLIQIQCTLYLLRSVPFILNSAMLYIV